MIGLLWSLIGERDFATALAEATRRYTERIGGKPRICVIGQDDYLFIKPEPNGLRYEVREKWPHKLFMLMGDSDDY